MKTLEVSGRNPDSAVARPERRDDAMVREQVQALCASQLLSIPMNCALALSTVFTVTECVPRSTLEIWLFTILFINLSRFCFVSWQVRRTFEIASLYRIRRVQSWLMTITGFVWAFVPVVLLDMTRPQAAAIVFILAGLTAGATVQAGTYALGAAALVVPVFGSLVGRFLINGTTNDYVLAFDSALFLLFLISSSRKSERALLKTLQLRTQATSLAVSLEAEHQAAQAAAARYFELANHDPLTGLANRAAFSVSLKAWLDRARDEGNSFSFFLLDLDHFKSINDTLGHGAGDEILKEVGRRLSSAIAGEHVVARLGGDEFSVLVAGPTGVGRNPEGVGVVADHILKKVGGMHMLGEHAISIGVSLGIAKFPDDGATAENLMAHADLALYAAKDGGRHRYRRFDASLLAKATLARQIEHDLPLALSTRALQVFYQPQIALDDERLVGLEALLRWNHPVHGWLPPPIIVAAARRIRKSDLLIRLILEDACQQIRRLLAHGAAEVLVAVNISPSELVDMDLPDVIKGIASAHRVDYRHLEIEITEEAFAASGKALETLKTLSAMGLRLAIDDFGTGYSSIGYLSSMSVDRIKIDRSLVTGIVEREGARILVKAILGIGHSLGIDVLAEGVETAEEAQLLKSLGCTTVQGFYFGRPMDPIALKTWLATRNRPVQSERSIVGLFRGEQEDAAA